MNHYYKQTWRVSSKDPNRSPNPKKKTLGQFFFENAEKHYDEIAQIDATIDRPETFGNVKTRSVRVAIEMRRRGITSLDIVATCCPSTLDNTIPILASLFLGATITFMNKYVPQEHIRHYLNLVEPKMIFVEESAVGLIETCLSNADFHHEIVVFGNSDKYSTFADLERVAQNEGDFRPIENDPDDVGVMFCTSGTTGTPKVICHSSTSLLWTILHSCDMGMDCPMLFSPNFFWISSMILFGCSFKAGVYRVFDRNMTTETIFKLIDKYGLNFALLPPWFVFDVDDIKTKYDISSLKSILCGGEVIQNYYLKKLKKLFPNVMVSKNYGMSEAGFVIGFNLNLDRHRELIHVKKDSCGLPYPGVHLKIVDINTKEFLGPHQKGEICLKSPSNMKGYYQSDSTQVFDDDNFYKTGDFGYFDDDGCVYVLNRVSDVIRNRNEIIAPSTIEELLLENPNIKEAAIVEVSNLLVACVVLKKGCTLNEGEIETFLGDKIKLGGVIILERLPRLDIGKMLRKKIPIMYEHLVQ